jgi:hypothetical protein
MPVPLLNLDNRHFDDLMAELRGEIPRHAPEWTNHNSSDPGITLLELFCFVAEGLIYRTNRIPDASRRRFLELLGVKVEGSLEDAMEAVLRSLKEPWRAVTANDFETLVLKHYPAVARVRCLPDQEVDSAGLCHERAGHLSVIIVPFPVDSGDCCPSPDASLIQDVFGFLDERRLITCRHHVVGPLFSDVSAAASVVCTPQVKAELVRGELIGALKRFFSPVALKDGDQGWQFGRSVHESELYAVMEGVVGVDHVESLILRRSDGGAWIDAGRKIAIDPNSLVFFDEKSSEITVKAGGA